MTLEKKSKISLKQWVTTIRRYEYELPRLYEKLEYLEVKSIGYNSPSFEPKLSSNGALNKSTIDYWLECIDNCEKRIKRYESEVEKYYKFRRSLNQLEQSVLHSFFYLKLPPRTVVYNNKIKRHKFYSTIRKIEMLYYNCKTSTQMI